MATEIDPIRAEKKRVEETIAQAKQKGFSHFYISHPGDPRFLDEHDGSDAFELKKNADNYVKIDDPSGVVAQQVGLMLKMGYKLQLDGAVRGMFTKEAK